ncbi:MAG TPA: polysaccharide deacetylase family protein [Candidatus Limnocylindria bacterium]|nr:polysaccharide deacetylase family protein [Candidatus Limnocylindria bacterium]
MASSGAFARFVVLLEHMDSARPHLLRILTYHRVEWGHATPPPPPGVATPPDAFAEQMSYVQRHYRVVTVEELIDVVKRGRRLPPRAALITFDDGYQDFRDQAWPVMRSLGLPVVLFVPTAFPGDPERFFWWERLHHAITSTERRDALETLAGRFPLGTARERADAYARLRAYVKRMPHAQVMEWVEAACRDLGVTPAPPPILGWDALRELARQGVSISSHTRTHPLLTRIPIEEARAEVTGSLRDLERELGKALPILAYPAGAFDDQVVRMLEEEGIVLGFTTVRGVNDLDRAHPLRLRRINVGQRTSLPALRAQLAGHSVGLNRFHPLVAR